ncbi:MAG: thioredoxin 1 [Halobacteriales archaeon]|jgi:thioredoxin 1
MGEFHNIAAEGDLESLVAAEDAVIVDFHADWCGPCVAMEAFLEEIEDGTEAAIATIDTEAHKNLPETFDVSTLPTLLFYRDGELVHRYAGLPERHEFRDMVAEYT